VNILEVGVHLRRDFLQALVAQTHGLSDAGGARLLPLRRLFVGSLFEQEGAEDVERV
jgi:hypothetical protein